MGVTVCRRSSAQDFLREADFSGSIRLKVLTFLIAEF
jgi:hypothetical protein